MDVRGLTVCVEYDDLLEITLIRNMRHMRQCYVITAPHDLRTQALCAKIPSVQCVVTDAFYRGGAKFNKGLAIEETFKLMGRHGWFLVWDADTLFQSAMQLENIPLQVNKLYGARRLILNNPAEWTPDFNWSRALPSRDRCAIGYFQLFHADSEAIKITDERPDWYDATFTHAGGGDGYFTSRWPDEAKEWIPWKVLHLGPRDRNWFGRCSPRLDGRDIDNANERAANNAEFFKNAPWRNTANKYDEHVIVEGHKPTGYITGTGTVK